jgi:leucyl aminopeptidase
MSDAVVAQAEGSAVPLRLVRPGEVEAVLGGLAAPLKAQAELAKFAGKSGQVAQLVGDAGVALALAGLGEESAAMPLRALPAKLAPGYYALEPRADGPTPQDLALAWALGAYRFDRYRKQHGEPVARLVAPAGVDLGELRAVSHACALARDMINTPAGDMGPRQMETIAGEVPEAVRAEVTVTAGAALIEAGDPAVHAVGRAATAERAPRMTVEIAWRTFRSADARPRWQGRGVRHRWARHQALGRHAADEEGHGRRGPCPGARPHGDGRGPAGTPRPAVAGGGERHQRRRHAARRRAQLAQGPDHRGRQHRRRGPVDPRRCAGQGRRLEPALTLDLATLTGAARAALGPELPPYYTDDEDLAAAIAEASRAAEDPLWRMPLWAPYDAALDSDIADVKNDPDGWAQAGSVTAALFLKRFAPKGPWAHFDIFAWNPRNRPGWPQGAEAQAIRALYRLIQQRFA